MRVDRGPGPMSAVVARPARIPSALRRARGRLHLYAFYALVLVLLVTAIAAAGRWAELDQLTAIRERAEARLDLQTAMLEQELARYHYLPAAVGLNPIVRQLLAQPGRADLRDAGNRFLQALNQAAGASELYVLDAGGRVLAASNWNQPLSFVGIDLAYRSYFQDAVRTGVGRLYGIGTTSGEPGYYYAQAILDAGQTIGVAAVKVSLDRLESPWAQGPGLLAMVVDGDGVVILASQPAWKYHTLVPLSLETVQRIQTTRQFERASLTPLDMHRERDLDAGTRIVSLGEETGRRRRELLLQERTLATSGWRMILLSELDDVTLVVRSVQAVAGLGLGSLLLLGLYLRQRRRSRRLELAAKTALERANLELEHKVAERTQDLLAAQDKLVHAGKLAALGQMAAGITHELNQPLAALRTLSDNAKILLQRQRIGEAEGNLDLIGQIVERMGRITTQLKVFARKPVGVTGPVPLRPVIEHALVLVADRARSQEVAIGVQIVPPEVQAVADGVRLEQVLVNLLSNALDAVGSHDGGRIEVKVGRRDDRVTIAVADNGHGIPPEILPRLGEPFLTTKDPGAGLGLGLAISDGIVRELGGSLRGRNLAAGGAEFLVELPMALMTEGGDG